MLCNGKTVLGLFASAKVMLYGDICKNMNEKSLVFLQKERLALRAHAHHVVFRKIFVILQVSKIEGILRYVSLLL